MTTKGNFFNIKNNIVFILLLVLSCMLMAFFLHIWITKKNRLRSQFKKEFLKNIQVTSPAIITAGRNIAFESNNAITNAPASYLTMMDCCESDRISYSESSARLIGKEK